MSFFRSINNLSRAIRAPFQNARSFIQSNPVSRAFRASRGMGRQLNQARSAPSRMFKRWVPKRFRTASPTGEADADKDLPSEEASRRGGRRRVARGRRVRVARRIDFTQVHLISQVTGVRHVLHVGSTIGTHATEFFLNIEGQKAIRLQFSKLESAEAGAPLAVTLVSAPQDTQLTVDNRIARPTAPFNKGSLINIAGQTYTVELYAGGSLPAVTRVNAGWATNVGPRRDINQDSVGIYQHPKAYMFTVADGVGGGYAGEEVSEYAVKYLQSVFKKNIDYESLSWYDIYQTAYAYINQEVRNWVQRTPHPAGSTLTSLFIRSWTAYIAHVGDSRVYLLRHGEFQQLTTDHNADVEVETRNRAGLPVTVVKNILQQAIGKSDTIQPDIITIPIQPKDRLLMVTDGICSRVDDAEIKQLLSNASVTEVPDELIELANSRDNTDNASAIALDVMEESYERDIWVADPADRIYVGGPAWYLKLSQPQDMSTAYSIVTGTGCLLLTVALFTLTLIWSVRTFQDFIAPPATTSFSANVLEETPVNDTDLTLAPTDPGTTASQPGGLGELLGGFRDGTQAITPPPVITDTPTPQPTQTTRPTQTPLPSFTPTARNQPPSTTPIPLTSTLRVGD